MDRSQLQRLLPHQGPALWLERLLKHDPVSIHGLSDWSHLQTFGADTSPCYLFEAAAQLCAAHGALYGGDLPIRMASIAKLSQLNLHQPAPQREGELALEASQVALSPAGALYDFRIHNRGQLLLDGKLLLVLTHA
jgi:hypothetical protein